MEKKLFSVGTKLSHYKVFNRKFLAMDMRKTEILFNKSVYLGLSILDMSKTGRE